MKVLVTGAAGFIGSHAALRLLERGDTVVGIDNLNDYYDVNLKLAHSLGRTRVSLIGPLVHAPRILALAALSSGSPKGFAPFHCIHFVFRAGSP